jgi:transcriptional regulator with XRE-family HTH domain
VPGARPGLSRGASFPFGPGGVGSEGAEFMKQFETFGAILLRRRKELGLTQSQLAQRIGVQPNYIVYLEKGERKPSDRTVMKIARALELDKADLYLAANPHVREFLTINEENQIQRDDLPDGLRRLLDDGELCRRLEVSDDEIAGVSQLRLRGRVTTAEQYLTLILFLRRLFS